MEKVNITNHIELVKNLLFEFRSHLSITELELRLHSLQQNNQYHVIGIMEDDRCVSFAGYQFLENILMGNYLYIDDLYTVPKARQKGLATALLEEIETIAIINNCQSIQLDSGLSRIATHNFYIKSGFEKLAFHFQKTIQ